VLILAQKPEGQEALIRAARVAEEASLPAEDALSSTVIELKKASMKAQEKQAAEMSALTNKIAALATAQSHEHELTIGMVEGHGTMDFPVKTGHQGDCIARLHRCANEIIMYRTLLVGRTEAGHGRLHG